MGTRLESKTWRFFILALGISFFFWNWVIVFGWNIWTFPAVIFGALGLVGPALAEIILLSREHDREKWKDYWQRIFDIRRINIKWFILIIILFPTVNAVSILLAKMTGDELPQLTKLHELITHPYQIPGYLLFMLLFGPLPEELGWRGYGLDALQSRFNALWASLILGFMWSLWHLPLFFIKGTFQHNVLGFDTPGFWSYITGPIILSIIFTWVYNNTNRSTLSAILLHFMVNLAADLLPLNEKARIFSTLILLIMTIIIILIWGPQTLTAKHNKTFWHRGVFPHEMAFWLNMPFRRLILSPQKLIPRLHLQPNHHVLEIGPGGGYFSIELAKHLLQGKLELLDIQEQMIRLCQRKLAKHKLHNTGFTVGNASDLKFSDNSFDRVILVSVLGEITDPQGAIKEIHRVLKKGGILSITEQPGDPDFVPQQEIIKLCNQQGFKLLERLGKKNFTLNFEK